MFTVTLNAAGCLPDSDIYPMVFDSAREAWEHIASEIDTIEDDGAYLAAHTALHVTDFDKPGAIPADEDGFYRYNVEYVGY